MVACKLANPYIDSVTALNKRNVIRATPVIPPELAVCDDISVTDTAYRGAV